MNKAETIRTLRAIKGHPTSILLFIFISRRTVTQTEISAALGYDAKTTRRHLHGLLSIGLVEHPAPHAWHLPAGQLLLPGFPAILPPGDLPQLPSSGTKVGNSPCFALTTTTTVHDVDIHHVEEVSSTENREKIPVSSELALELRAAGIRQNAWPTLVALDHITPTYVQAMRTMIMNHPDPAKRNAAFLIHCMRSGDSAPQICDACGCTEPQHAIDCSTRRRRYAGGKYADFMET
jgi:hypothetical protein